MKEYDLSDEEQSQFDNFDYHPESLDYLFKKPEEENEDFNRKRILKPTKVNNFSRISSFNSLSSKSITKDLPKEKLKTGDDETEKKGKRPILLLKQQFPFF